MGVCRNLQYGCGHDVFLLRRSVFYEKMTEAIVEPLQKVLMHTTVESYKLAHKGREPSMDSVANEKITLTDGETLTGFRVADGPKDFFQLSTQEVCPFLFPWTM